MHRVLFILCFYICMHSQLYAQCKCSIGVDATPWEPNMSRGVDDAYLADKSSGFLANSLNGVYLYEDKDSIYQLKILIDPKGFSTFVHVHHVQFYKYTSHIKSKEMEQLFPCLPPRVRDGGMMMQYVFKPDKSWRKQFVASQILEASDRLRISRDETPWQLYQCPLTSERGIYLPNSRRFYKKVVWIPEGNYLQASLRTLLPEDLKPYNHEQLATMRNEIFARYNYQFDEAGKWYRLFHKTLPDRWNAWEDVLPFLTTIEKENIAYIQGFEKNYYDNQQQNDFLDFWKSFSATAASGNKDELLKYVEFPFKVYGGLDDMPVLKLNEKKFKDAWPRLIQQSNYDMDNNGQLVEAHTASAFALQDAFAERMIHKTSNNINNLEFTKTNGGWKLTGAYADFDVYPEVEQLVHDKK